MKFGSLTLLCASVVLLAFSPQIRADEPTYEHRSLTRWLQSYQQAKPASSRARASRQAVERIGTNALPELVRMLAGGDFSRQQLAVTGFEILGPAGAPAIPSLNDLLLGTNPVAGVFAASSLGNIGAPALPTLMNALTNGSFNVASLAAMALGSLGTNAAPAVPVFLRELNSYDHFTRERAADALGNLHLQPDVVVPALTNLLHDRSLAARCLGLNALGRYQAAARPAVGVIEPLLQDPESDVRASATNALREIAPERFGDR